MTVYLKYLKHRIILWCIKHFTNRLNGVHCIQYTFILIYFTKVIQSRTVSYFLSDVWFTLFTQMVTAAILGCFRGIVHPKIKILLRFLLLLNAKLYIWNNRPTGNNTVAGPPWFNGDSETRFSKYLLLCWGEQKKNHRDLEQFEFKYMLTLSSFLGELSF